MARARVRVHELHHGDIAVGGAVPIDMPATKEAVRGQNRVREVPEELLDSRCPSARNFVSDRAILPAAPVLGDDQVRELRG
jgi:hypothetical protein